MLPGSSREFFLCTYCKEAYTGEHSAPEMFPNRNNATSGEHLLPILCPNGLFPLPVVIFRDLCGIFVNVN